MAVINGKGKPVLLWLVKDGPQRFSEIKRKIPGVTQKMLTRQLQALEADGIVHREVFPPLPRRHRFFAGPPFLNTRCRVREPGRRR